MKNTRIAYLIHHPTGKRKQQTSYLVYVESSARSSVICRYDLRWPVIMDSFSYKQYSLEDCQMVFLEVTHTILERRQRMGQILTEDEENYIKYKYDVIIFDNEDMIMRVV